MITIERILNSLHNKGIKGSFQRLIEGSKIDYFKEDTLNYLVDREIIPFNKADYRAHMDKDPILNWIVPEMGPGSGGHINIFRFVSYLENHGIHNRIYLYRSKKFKTNEEFIEFLHKYFPILDTKVEAYNNVKEIQFAHGTIATGWDTAYFVRNFYNTISRFYFVQDYEPYFYPNGSFYAFAENTYTFGLRGLTAGNWLKTKCEEYGMKADAFSFSYDKGIYSPKEKKDDTKRVFFYARPVTPRRDFELGILALNELKKMVPDVEIVMAGWDLKKYVIPFDYTDLGIMKIEDLSEVYSNCDMCFVISNTNLSLLPLEIMGSGSVPVCTNGKNSTWLVNDKNSVLVNYDPLYIADTMKYYLENPNELAKKREQAIAFAQSTSWEENGEIVRQAILKGIKEDNEDIDNRG